MSEPLTTGGATLPPTLARQMDRVCDRFEAAWKAGQQPRIEDYLDAVPEPGHGELLRHLLELELAYRGRNGERPALEDYRARFPEYVESIATVFDALTTATPGESRSARSSTIPGGSESHLGNTAGDVDRRAAPVIPGYEVIGELGRGAMGVVYHARQVRLNRPCALKVILAGDHAGSEATTRFLAEAEAVARLQDPHIVQIHSIGDHDGRSYLDLEYVEGGSLADRIKGTPWLPREAAGMVETLARAIAEAHRLGVVHRDLKPANVLLTADGTPKITDFGLAKLLDSESVLTRTDMVMGTPSYMAPEQASGRAREAGAAADVYALGAIFYELLIGRPPFKAATALETLELVKTAEPVPPSRLVPGLPRDVETIALKCLQKEPSKRYAAAEDLAEDLRRFLAREPIRARRVGRAERLWRWCRRNPAVATLTSSVVLLLVLIAAGATAAAWRFKRDGEAVRAALRDSYLVQAQALRYSGRPGRRFAGLDAVAKAAAIRPGPDLRDEAITGMALVDLRVFREWDGASPGSTAIAFDPPLGRYARSDKRGNISVRRVADDRELLHLPGPGDPAWVLQFSPDGQFLAAKYHPIDRWDPNRFLVWHLGRGTVVLDLPSGIRGTSVDFSRADRRLAVGRQDGSIALYDLASGRVLEQMGGGPGPIGLALHPDGTKVAASGYPTMGIRVFDLVSGGLLIDLLHSQAVPSLAWSPDGTRLAAGCADGTIYLWDIAARGRPLILRGHWRGQVTRVAFSHGGDLLASCGWDKTTRLWDPFTGRQLVSIPGAAGVQFSPDDRRLAHGAIGTKLQLWEVADGRECRALAMSQEPRGVDFSADGRLLAAVGDDGVQLWDVATAVGIASWKAAGLQSVWFHPDGRSLIASGGSGLHHWPIAPSGEAGRGDLRIGPPRSVDVPEFGPPGNADLCADGRTLVVSDRPHGKAVVLDLESEKVLFRGDFPGIDSVAISPDGRWIASSTWRSHPPQLRVWDLQGKGLERDLAAMRGFVAFSPDGHWLVIGAADEYRLYEVGSWRLHRRIRRDSTELQGAAAFSRDGTTLAIVPALGQVQLLDPATGRHRATLTAPNSLPLHGLRFSPDGTHLAAASISERVIQVWDLRLIRRQLATLGLDWSPSPSRPGARSPSPDSGPPDQPADRIAVRCILVGLSQLPGATALHLDGVDDCIRIDDSPSLRPKDITLEGWFNFAALEGIKVLIAKTFGTGTCESFIIWHEGASLIAGVGDAVGIAPLLWVDWKPTPGIWYHIAYTFNDERDTQALYVDGILRASGQTPKTIAYDSHPVTIGAEYENERLAYWFPGSIAEVRIWGIARTPAEIQADKDRTLAGTEAGLLGYWKLENESGTKVLDATANHNDGTLGGATEKQTR